MRTLGIISAVVMPFFNIPLMYRIVRRKSSRDISLVWTIGVWLCIVGMFPATLVSADPVLKAYGIVNTLFFSGVALVVILYRFRSPKD
jgi:uncharacterized protein with PQ loop repeat